jgi:hypothetical protein
MKEIRALLLLGLVLFVSCNKNDDPLGPVNTSEFDPTYLGKIGSVRVYSQEDRWYIAGTDSPYVNVPDSILGEIQLSRSDLRQGIVSRTKITQRVDTVAGWFYSAAQLVHPRNEYERLEELATGYNLVNHLQALSTQSSYSGEYSHGGGDYRESSDSLLGVSVGSSSIFLLKPIGQPTSWIRDQWTYYDSASAMYRSHNVSCRAIGQTSVSVSAGNFEAYKIEVTMNWPDLNYGVFWKYEYYVPNIGLVLEESDLLTHILTLSSSGSSSTITVRMVRRKELTSFAVVR